MDDVKILTPGGYTTIQDSGRFGYQNMGVPVSGVLDHFSFAVANCLVGNPENTPVMEITVVGPTFEIFTETDIALTGAQMGIRVNGNAVEQWQSVRVFPGDRVSIGQIESGCRAYLAFGGGPDLPDIMGSCSTYVGAGIGGLNGRPLKPGDTFKLNRPCLLHERRRFPEDRIPVYPTHVTLRAVPGPQDDYFDIRTSPLFITEYTVSAKADRMGCRLTGESIPIKDGMPKSIVSEPSVPGSIQIPPDEQPIILLVEQTVGGYAKIATIISSDIRRVAQITPGDTIRFKKIDLQTAHKIHAEEKKRFQRLKEIF